MNRNSKNIRKSIKAISSEVLNGENYSRDDFARSILNYPAMMVPSVQEPIIEKLSYTRNRHNLEIYEILFMSLILQTYSE